MNLLILILFIVDCGYGQISYPFRSGDKQAILAYWYNCKPDTAIEAAIKDTAFIHSTLEIYGPVLADSFRVETEVFAPQAVKAYTNKFLVRKDMKSSGFTTEVINGYFKIIVPVSQLNENPERIRITISSQREKLEKWIDCKYHKLYGKISNFSGQDLKSYILVRSDGFNTVCGVWSDSHGNYEILLPERTYNCFYINDGNYKATTLEAWAWHMIVDSDQKLDYKIGTGEVYNLNVWPSNGGPNLLFISFRPMVLYYNNTSDTAQTLNNKQFRLIHIAPELDLQDISVTINGNQTEKYSIQKYFETGRDLAMPAYIIQVRRLMPSFGKQTIRVDYEKTIEIEGKKVLQNSMGYFQFYPNFYGLSSFN
jgi:hypothetical protein